MTNKERVQVVELLRCAADQNDKHRGSGLNGMFGAASDLGYSDGDLVDEFAWAVVNELNHDCGADTESYRELLLEAAARVEERIWP